MQSALAIITLIFPLLLAPCLASRLAAQESADPLPPNPGIDGGAGGHWGIRNDSDWLDNRYQEMDTGPFLSSSLNTAFGHATKGVSMRLGKTRQAAAVFDTLHCNVLASWTGEFLTLSPKRFGLIEMPRIAGKVRFGARGEGSWTGGKVEYRRLFRSGGRVVFEYRVGKRPVEESLWFDDASGAPIFTRRMRFGPGPALSLSLITELDAQPAKKTIADHPLAILRRGSHLSSALLRQKPGFERVELRAEGESIRVDIPASKRSLSIELFLCGEESASSSLEHLASKLPATRRRATSLPETLSIVRLISKSPSLWRKLITTRGHVSQKDAPYVIDTITIPYDNPYGAMMYLSGLDFLSNGNIAVCTVHGDVWTVSGIDDRLETLRWRRFATGLYQPLGLVVVDDKIFVLGRDRITKLHDRNRDGEADEYESFASAWPTSLGGHDYSTCLERDAEGRFYFVSPRGLHRVSADGKSHEIIATGFRNPNGLSVSRSGVITVAPQEGDWTPASMVCEIREGGYYGFPGPKKTPDSPLGYDPPLCYLPRHIDNSTGGQVWVTSERWGPLRDQLLNLSFGRCSMQLVLRDELGGTTQGAAVPLPGRFLSGAVRGRFHEGDGQLYVCGMNGWVTNAIAEGSLQRVRFTGKSTLLPIGWKAHKNGLLLEFSEELEPEFAENADSYSASVWNYEYAAHYGSQEFSIARPGVAGHDSLKIEDARLLEDGRAVFLVIPDLQPVKQLHLQASISRLAGDEKKLDFFATVHALRPALDLSTLPPRSTERTERSITKREISHPGLVLLLASLKPGTSLKTGPPSMTAKEDARVSRVAALRVLEGEAASPFLDAGPFRAIWKGRLRLTERRHLRFSASLSGRVDVKVAGKLVLETSAGKPPEKSKTKKSAPVRLERGDHPIEIVYHSPARGDAWFRLYWESRDFARETVPPEVLHHVVRGEALTRGETLRKGRRLFATGRCLKCHSGEGVVRGGPGAMPELAMDAPSFRGIGSRLHGDWMRRWIIDPQALNAEATMPRLGMGIADAERQKVAADISAFLLEQREENVSGKPSKEVIAATSDLNPDRIRSGAKLFAQLGCIACHRLPGDFGQADGSGRRPLALVAMKWKPRALVKFLRAPRRHYAWSGMPDLALSTSEAEQLATYLLETSKRRTLRGDSGSTSKGNATHGRRHVREFGCLACHELEETSMLSAPPLCEFGDDWSTRGCLAAPSDRGRAPDLALDEDEKSAIRLFARSSLPSLDRRSLIEFSHREMLRLRCHACHDRDAGRSVWSEHIVETQALVDARQLMSSELRPSLTLTGDRLNAAWIESLLRGDLPYRVRPWLGARMPRFPTTAAELATGIAFDHGQSFSPANIRRVTENSAAIGRQLLETQGGFGCVACHSIGSRPARMQLHFGVINLAHAHARLRPEFYMRWMLNPQRLLPQTQMPAYSDPGGYSILSTVLGGDARLQFTAIWNALPAEDERVDSKPK